MNKTKKGKIIERLPDKKLRWKCFTPQLLNEILENPGTSILKIPLTIFASILDEIATRCSELNDPKLNALMCRLALYAIADPTNKEDYDPIRANEIINKAYEEK